MLIGKLCQVCADGWELTSCHGPRPSATGFVSRARLRGLDTRMQRYHEIEGPRDCGLSPLAVVPGPSFLRDTPGVHGPFIQSHRRRLDQAHNIKLYMPYSFFDASTVSIR